MWSTLTKYQVGSLDNPAQLWNWRTQYSPASSSFKRNRFVLGRQGFNSELQSHNNTFLPGIHENQRHFLPPVDISQRKKYLTEREKSHSWKTLNEEDEQESTLDDDTKMLKEINENKTSSFQNGSGVVERFNEDKESEDEIETNLDFDDEEDEVFVVPSNSQESSPNIEIILNKVESLIFLEKIVPYLRQELKFLFNENEQLQFAADQKSRDLENLIDIHDGCTRKHQQIDDLKRLLKSTRNALEKERVKANQINNKKLHHSPLSSLSMKQNSSLYMVKDESSSLLKDQYLNKKRFNCYKEGILKLRTQMNIINDFVLSRLRNEQSDETNIDEFGTVSNANMIQSVECWLVHWEELAINIEALDKMVLHLESVPSIEFLVPNQLLEKNSGTQIASLLSSSPINDQVFDQFYNDVRDQNKMATTVIDSQIQNRTSGDGSSSSFVCSPLDLPLHMDKDNNSHLNKEFQFHELKTLELVSRGERERLKQLTAVLQREVNEAENETANVHHMLRKEQAKGAWLQKSLEKTTLLLIEAKRFDGEEESLYVDSDIHEIIEYTAKQNNSFFENQKSKYESMENNRWEQDEESFDINSIKAELMVAKEKVDLLKQRRKEDLENFLAAVDEARNTFSSALKDIKTSQLNSLMIESQ